MKLIKILQETLEEDASLNYAGKKVRMRLKPNINPTKQGIRIQFSFGGGDLDSNEKDAFTTGLQTILNKALSPYGMSVNSDPDVPNQGEEIIGFYLTIIPYAINLPLIDILMYGILNACLYGITAIYVSNIISFQALYLYFLCKYLTFKIQSINNTLMAVKRRKYHNIYGYSR